MKFKYAKLKIYPVKLNFYLTGTIFTLIIFFSFFCVVGSSQAVNLYVDQTLSTDCTIGNYSTTNRACTGTDGATYRVAQDAVNFSTYTNIPKIGYTP